MMNMSCDWGSSVSYCSIYIKSHPLEKLQKLQLPPLHKFKFPKLKQFVSLFLDLNLSITNGIVSTKIYNKRDDFSFEIVNFPFLDGDVSRSPSYGVYISQLIRFARVCSNVDEFNNRNLTVNLIRVFLHDDTLH